MKTSTPLGRIVMQITGLLAVLAALVINVWARLEIQEILKTVVHRRLEYYLLETALAVLAGLAAGLLLRPPRFKIVAAFMTVVLLLLTLLPCAIYWFPLVFISRSLMNLTEITDIAAVLFGIFLVLWIKAGLSGRKMKKHPKTDNRQEDL